MKEVLVKSYSNITLYIQEIMYILHTVYLFVNVLLVLLLLLNK